MTEEPKTLAELAHLVGGRVVGNESVKIRGVAPIDEAGPGDITFLADPRYHRHLKNCRAAAVIVGPGTMLGEPTGAAPGWLVVSRPYLAFAKILQLFAPVPVYDREISPESHVDPRAVIEADVTVFPHVYVGRDARVGRGSVLYPGVFIGDEAQVGDNCVLHPHVVIRERCRVGNRVVLHAGVVIGADGFGYAGEGKDRAKIPQIGIVEIEDEVEIGANTTVDRATLGKTVIRQGTKIDNLVQIGHNVIVGEYTVIAAQAGIAGSSRIGAEVVLAGQVGVADHIEIGDRAKIGGQSGVPRSVPPGALLSGALEATPHRQWLKVMTLLPQLPKLWERVRRLERKTSAAARKGKKGVKSHA